MKDRGLGSPLAADSIAPGECAIGRVGDEDVAIFNIEGRFYAIQNDCTHAGGPLCEGSLWGDVIGCPWHGSEFNVKTGEVVSGPADVPVKSYQVEVIDGMIQLRR